MKVDPLLEPLLAGDRRALAQAITLIESTRSDHRERADVLLGALLPHAASRCGSASPACRVSASRP